jgi:hypothetical protein
MAEKPLARRASGPFGNGPVLLVIGDAFARGDVSSLPIPMGVAA